MTSERSIEIISPHGHHRSPPERGYRHERPSTKDAQILVKQPSGGSMDVQNFDLHEDDVKEGTPSLITLQLKTANPDFARRGSLITITLRRPCGIVTVGTHAGCHGEVSTAVR
uniref:Uncharacterized protein n=1 Tax=Physcomitrium patens TaxID=3218 RepID=A9TWB5_PHYPA|nr:hypothetical protein PHYPA_021554 [Physcomitrium patens]